MNKRVFIGICALILAMLATASTSYALPTVNNKNNSGAGSLRDAIINANNGDTIDFSPGLSGTIVLASPPLTLSKNLTIIGPGAGVLGVDGNGGVGIFRLTTGTTAISGLRISNGFVSGAGGGISVDGGNLTLNNCSISGNDSESGGGAVVFGGSSLTIINSTVSGNISAVEGGGISNRGGTLTMINSTINGNRAPQGGGVSADGGMTTILNCTITDNGNTSVASGAVGGLRVAVGSAVNIKNTIVANNIVAGTSIPDVGGSVNSQFNNLIGASMGSSGFSTTNDLLDVNPQLSPLAANGGTTRTQALMTGSPAIDAGNNTGAPATDQRGVARPQNTIVDIGAFESGVSAWTGLTTTGANVNADLGTVTVTFSGVSSAGTTAQVPIDPAAAGSLPSGYSLGVGFPAYEITTTAVYTAPITVCVQVPSVTNPAVFNALAFFHSEGGILVNRTSTRDFASKTICALVNSLSPFVVAEDLAPTAANVSVGGRVVDFYGNPISRAKVSITGQNGETRWTITGSLGRYRFDEIAVGGAYVVSVSQKRYRFDSQILTVSDDILNADFTALPESEKYSEPVAEIKLLGSVLTQIAPSSRAQRE